MQCIRIVALTSLAALLSTAQVNRRPVQPVGRITDTSFPGRLAASVNGTLPTRTTRFPPVFLLGGSGFYPQVQYPSYPLPLNLSVEQVNSPAVVFEQPPVTPAAPFAAEENTVRVYSNPVVMEQPSATPGALEKQNASGQSAETLYLIALNDGSVLAAIAYWTDGSQLKYITRDRKQKQAVLNNVDMELSSRLNQERGVAFILNRR